MDVSCPSCKSEYELDDARVPAEGVTVKCASCQYVFKVKRPEARAPSLTTPGGGSGVAGSALPPAPPSREWKVRQVSGNVYTCRELTTLQKWIIEGKVVRDDEISLSGDAWKRLGNIPELASFFQVVEDAARARSYDALKSVSAPQPAFVTSSPPPPVAAPPERLEPMMAKPPPPPPPSMPTSPTETLKGARLPPLREPPVPAERSATEYDEATDPEGRPRRPQSGPHRPSPSRARQPELESESEDFEDSLRAAGVKRSGRSGWILLLIAGLGLGGGLGYYFGWYVPEQEARAAEKRAAEKALADETQKREEAEARAKAEQAKAVVPAKELDAGEPVVVPAVVVDAGAPPVIDAGAPEVVDAGQPVVDAGVKAPKKAEPVHDYDWYMARADRLREQEKSEAALDMYGRAAELHPDRAEPLAGRGLALLDMGRAVAAQASLEQALAINRSYGPAIMGLAEAYRAGGNTEKAIQYYQRYLEVLPNGPEAAVARNQLERLKK